MKKRFGFTGQNITAKRDTSRPNLEFINANIDSLPTLEELKEQYAAAREQWNSMKHPATGIPRIEMYNTSVNEATDPVAVHRQRYRDHGTGKEIPLRGFLRSR